jgi:hypothetical protein
MGHFSGYLITGTQSDERAIYCRRWSAGRSARPSDTAHDTRYMTIDFFRIIKSSKLINDVPSIIPLTILCHFLTTQTHQMSLTHYLMHCSCVCHNLSSVTLTHVIFYIHLPLVLSQEFGSNPLFTRYVDRDICFKTKIRGIWAKMLKDRST